MLRNSASWERASALWKISLMAYVTQQWAESEINWEVLPAGLKKEIEVPGNEAKEQC